MLVGGIVFFSTIIKEHRKHLHFSVYTKQHLTAVFKEDQCCVQQSERPRTFAD